MLSFRTGSGIFLAVALSAIASSVVHAGNGSPAPAVERVLKAMEEIKSRQEKDGTIVPGDVAEFFEFTDPNVKSLVRYFGAEDGLAVIDLNIDPTISDQSRRVRVSPTQLLALPAGSSLKVDEALQPLKDIILNFSLNERVRFRDDSGRIQTGRIVRFEPSFVQLRVGPGQINRVDRRQVYKQVGFIPPHTPTMNGVDWLGVKFGLPRAQYLQLLEGAAKLTSLPGFSTLDSLDQVVTLLRYLRIHFQFRRSMLNAEEEGFHEIHELVCAGAGACRHLAPVLSVILAESGIHAELMAVKPEFMKRSHMWVEVDLPQGATGISRFIVDPTFRYYDLVFTQEQLRDFVRDPRYKGFAKTILESFWTSPNKIPVPTVASGVSAPHQCQLIFAPAYRGFR